MEYNRTNLYRLLNQFEETFKDTDFTHKGVNYYPVIKIQYGYQLYLLYIKGMPKSLGNAIEKNTPLNSIRFFYYQLKDFATGIKNSLKKKLTPGVLIAGFSEHKKDKLIYGYEKLSNPFITPFEIFLSETSIKFDHIDIDRISEEENELKKLFSAYPVKEKLVRSSLSSNRKLVENISSIEKFSEINKVVLPGLADYLLINIVQNITYYSLYKSFLQKSGYKKIIFYCYYNNQVMALNRAARDLGIETIEYQHSQQSDDHFAYGKWKYNMAKADHHFPAVFWVWSASDNDRLQINFKGIQSKIITGGNLYLSLLHEKFSNSTLKENSILVVLQGFWIPEFIEQSIINNPAYKWYLRLHPRYPQDRLKAENLKKKLPQSVEIDEANNLSLYELFGKVKFAITAFSGTALEAQAFGIQNIIYGEDGYNSYKEYIDANAFFHVKNSVELDLILEKKMTRLKPYNLIELDQNKVRSIIKKTFSKN